MWTQKIRTSTHFRFCLLVAPLGFSTPGQNCVLGAPTQGALLWRKPQLEPECNGNERCFHLTISSKNNFLLAQRRRPYTSISPNSSLLQYKVTICNDYINYILQSWLVVRVSGILGWRKSFIKALPYHRHTIVFGGELKCRWQVGRATRIEKDSRDWLFHRLNWTARGPICSSQIGKLQIVLSIGTKQVCNYWEGHFLIIKQTCFAVHRLRMGISTHLSNRHQIWSDLESDNMWTQCQHLWRCHMAGQQIPPGFWKWSQLRGSTMYCCPWFGHSTKSLYRSSKEIAPETGDSMSRTSKYTWRYLETSYL